MLVGSVLALITEPTGPTRGLKQTKDEAKDANKKAVVAKEPAKYSEAQLKAIAEKCQAIIDHDDLKIPENFHEVQDTGLLVDYLWNAVRGDYRNIVKREEILALARLAKK